MSLESPERYRRRHRWPILVALVVLLVAGGFVWFQVLKPPPAAATGCNKPGPAPTSSRATTSGTVRKATVTNSTTSAGTSGAGAATTGTPITTALGTYTSTNVLSGTPPADPGTFVLTVYNASNTPQLATTVSQNLQQAGFALVGQPHDDPLYPASDLICQAEIRFGPAGLANARTVLIVAPCAQLIMDNRVGDNIDLALGANYTYAAATPAMQAQLKAAHAASAPAAVIEGQTIAPKPPPPVPPLPACTPPASTASTPTS